MSPLPGTDPSRDELAAKLLEQLVATPSNVRATHCLVDVQHLRRPGDALVLHTEAGVVHVSTTLAVMDTVDVLRDVAEKLENGDHR